MGQITMTHYDNGNCDKCGCYWGVSDDIAKASGCECDCHE